MWPFERPRVFSAAGDAWANRLPVREDASRVHLAARTSRRRIVFLVCSLSFSSTGLVCRSDGPSNDRIAIGGARQAAPWRRSSWNPKDPATVVVPQMERLFSRARRRKKSWTTINSRSRKFRSSTLSRSRRSTMPMVYAVTRNGC